ncbi:hypothetical protein F3Y22_tig00116997pilonHSYRG00211 [Hibiscus syriacus]|uniref:RNase H type-1 domain-containing protein n=1 Tax=Hibiscus syriacus TaxID=106335 RepID=A0A6A2WG70_HIBSY|nr:hypothetical protein F3Y22_tig00116997pilonHSYRG00211 [Hibiscus syriacus]
MWRPPPKGWMKINADGACTTATGLTASSGVIRDSNGQMAREMGLRSIVVESDCKDALNLLQRGGRMDGGSHPTPAFDRAPLEMLADPFIIRATERK